MGRKWEPIHCSHELRHIGILAFEFSNDNYHINHTKRCRWNISLYNPIRRCLINLTLTMRSRSLTFRNRAVFAILCGTQIIIIRHHLIRKNDKHTVAIGGCQLQFYFYSLNSKPMLCYAMPTVRIIEKSPVTFCRQFSKKIFQLCSSMCECEWCWCEFTVWSHNCTTVTKKNPLLSRSSCKH